MRGRPLLVVDGVSKVYPDGVRALDRVSMEVGEGEVHAVLGENGAGKTTLMRIIYGEIRPTEGRIIYRGVEARWRGTLDAIRSGVAMVYQNFSLVPTMTVRENIALYLSSLGASSVEGRIEEAVRLTGLSIPLDSVVEELPMGVRQRVEIVKAVAGGARLLILDEPTTHLTPGEAGLLFRVVRRLSRSGVSVIYITHKLGEVAEIADRVTVLRRGRVVGVVERGSMDAATLSRLMIGEDLPPARGRSRPPGRRVMLRVSRVSLPPRLRGVSLEVRESEILGVAGVAGNGQEELVEAVIGLRRPSEGFVEVAGRRVESPRDFYSAGGGYIPGDRRRALALDMSVAENAAFIAGTSGGPWLLTRGRYLEVYESLVRDYSLKSPSPWHPLGSLSGGNQQKVLVGSELLRRPRVIVAENPTQGLDVATARFVRNLLLELRDRGACVLLVSTDLDEVAELSDRIAVMSGGRVVGLLDRGEASPEEIGRLMGGAV